MKPPPTIKERDSDALYVGAENSTPLLSDGTGNSSPALTSPPCMIWVTCFVRSKLEPKALTDVRELICGELTVGILPSLRLSQPKQCQWPLWLVSS